jgi:hypothetical protein
VGALLNVADCHERHGLLIQARATCLEARDLALAKGERERATFAETRIHELEQLTPALRITSPNNPVPGLRVRRDGEALDPNQVGEVLRMDPGTHRIDATAPGRRPFHQEVKLPSSDAVVMVWIPPLEQATPGPASDGGTLPTAGLVVAGIGAAGVIAGLVAGGLAWSHWNDVTSSCPGGHCPDVADHSHLLASRNTAGQLATASTISIALGSVLLAGGLTLYFLSPRKTSGAGLEQHN